jgi:hypothetical protein
MVFPDFRDQIDLGFDVAAEFGVDLRQVGANRVEDLRERERRFSICWDASI